MKRKNTYRFLSSKQLQPYQMAEEWQEREIPSDVLGSYTGQGEEGDPPVQDADDL